jgi:hypothetical protein
MGTTMIRMKQHCLPLLDLLMTEASSCKAELRDRSLSEESRATGIMCVLISSGVRAVTSGHNGPARACRNRICKQQSKVFVKFKCTILLPTLKKKDPLLHDTSVII